MSELNIIETAAGRFPVTFFPSESSGNAPGLLLLHGSDGLKEHHHAFARRLAKAGYAVLMPQWFGPETPYKHWDGITRPDLEAMWEMLARSYGVLSNRRGLLGFSRGGGLAVVAASFLPGVAGVVDYFGLTGWKGGLEEFTGLQWGRREGPELEFVGRIAASVLILHGQSDTVVECKHSRELARMCKHFDVACEPHFFSGVDHSFCWPENEKFNPTTDREAFEYVEHFLAKTLGR